MFEGAAMTGIAKKRCRYCHIWFEPDKRKIDIQTACMKPACQRRRQEETSREWWSNPNNVIPYEKRKMKIAAWAKKTRYWKKRREEDEDYREKDNARRKASRRAAKQISITEISVEERARSLGLEVYSAAKQISIRPFFIGEPWGDMGVGWPFWSACAAKHISIPVFTG
jgi:hypothetical protein